jgi:hypothetical protein
LPWHTGEKVLEKLAASDKATIVTARKPRQYDEWDPYVPPYDPCEFFENFFELLWSHKSLADEGDRSRPVIAYRRNRGHQGSDSRALQADRVGPSSPKSVAKEATLATLAMPGDRVADLFLAGRHMATAGSM